MRRTTTLAVMAASAVAVACGDSTYGGGGGGGGGTGGRTTSVSVGASGNNFAPKFDTVSAGALVTWTWSNGPHTVTFEALNDSSAQMSSGTFQVTFNTPGTYRYRCLVHSTVFGSGMSGSVTVE